jgi:hypothetical protein
MKKRILIALLCLILVLSVILALTGGFTKGVLSEYIYFPRNVYEEIWNLVLSEERGCATVLTYPESAYVDCDLGMFQNIQIPSCNVVLSWWDGLSFLFWTDKGNYIHYVYDYRTQTLTADTELAYLTEQFLRDYFQWCETSPDFSSKFSLENLGECFYQCPPPSAPSTPENSIPTLNLATLKDLVKRQGKGLTWENLAPYWYEDIRSEIYTLRYPVAADSRCCYLIVNGLNTSEPPKNIRLESAHDSKIAIDVRTENIDSFLAVCPVCDCKSVPGLLVP